MKIVLLNQYYAPDEAATAQLLADVGAGLARAGHDVLAVCSDRAYADAARRYPRREVIDGVRIRRLRTTGFGRSRGVGRILDYLTFLAGVCATLLCSARPDVVLCLSTPPMLAAFGLALAKLRGARVVFWVMDVYPELAFELGVVDPGSLAGRVLRRVSGATLRRSDRVVALGEQMAAHLRSGAGIEAEVIHNWADGETIRPLPVEGHPLRRAWGWDGRFVVLYSGNMGLGHEFDTVLQAADRLREHRSVLFAFVGGGPRRAAVHAEAERLGLPNVEFRPYVPRSELGLSLTAGDVHLLTLREGVPGLLVPSKIYGILAAGRPTLYVGPDRGEVAEILREGGCGETILPGDANALVRAVLAHERDAGCRGERGRRARELFDERFTRRRGVAAFVRLVDGLTAAGLSSASVRGGSTS